MTRARGWSAPLAAVVAVVLAVPLLAGCEAAQQALADVEAAARRLASTCGVDAGEVGGG